MDALDKKIIQAMQDEFPVVEKPYEEIAGRIGITEVELLDRLKMFKHDGQIRKMGAVLRHREVGFSSNVLCAWAVPAEQIELVAEQMSESTAVSHCYDRNTMPDWPYSVYTMIHGHSREECNAIAEQLAEKTHIVDRVMLFSVKEWKKNKYALFF